MQTVWITNNNDIEELRLPAIDDEVIDGVRWGAVDEFFTAAFWKCQSELHIRKAEYSNHRLGRNLLEEVAVCLLGGYGIPAEMGLKAFERLKVRNLVDGNATEEQLKNHLSEPFQIGGRSMRYRFAGQKAKYLASCLPAVSGWAPECGDLELRDQLKRLPGIGPKTASWIVRNHRASDQVAIIDIHLHRAGRMIGLFPDHSEPTKDYASLEQRFLTFAEAIAVRASVLDALIWDYMRRIGPTSGHRRSNRASAQPEQLALAF